MISTDWARRRSRSSLTAPDRDGEKISWNERARADLRAIDQQTALHLLHALAGLRLRKRARLNASRESSLLNSLNSGFA
jgi:hypothetical protein